MLTRLTIRNFKRFREVEIELGNPVIQTPNLDRLARRGARFTRAYTTCPICVPARASLATGRYVHQIGYWDNAFGYDGRIPSWGHRLREQGHRVDSIGKLRHNVKAGMIGVNIGVPAPWPFSRSPAGTTPSTATSTSRAMRASPSLRVRR